MNQVLQCILPTLVSSVHFYFSELAVRGEMFCWQACRFRLFFVFFCEGYVHIDLLESMCHDFKLFFVYFQASFLRYLVGFHQGLLRALNTIPFRSTGICWIMSSRAMLSNVRASPSPCLNPESFGEDMSTKLTHCGKCNKFD